MDSDPDEPQAMEEEEIQKANYIEEVELLDTDEEVEPVKSLLPAKPLTKAAQHSDSDSSIEIEESKRRRQIVWQCLEPDCTNAKKSDLITATNYILACYNIKPDPKKKRKICTKCNEGWMRVLKEQKEKIRNKEPLLSTPLPVPKDIVMLDDSDEKSETDDSESSEFELDISTGEHSEEQEDTDDSLDAADTVKNLVASLLKEVNFNDQCSSSIAALTKRMDEMKPTNDYLTQRFEDLEAEVKQLNKELYEDFEPIIQELPPLDIPLHDEQQQHQPNILQQPQQVESHQQLKLAQQLPQQQLQQSIRYQHQQLANRIPVQSPGKRLHGLPKGGPGHPASNVQAKQLPFVPKPGLLERPQPGLGDSVYMMRGKDSLNIWKEGKVEELVSADDTGTFFKIKFTQDSSGKKMNMSKVRNLKQLAYFSAAPVKISVGVRVIGMYREKDGVKGAFYAGIIAEPPKGLNDNRYLVFFDDGVARYIVHNELRVVCQSSTNVADDIHQNSRDFIKNYLQQYPERPMVKLAVDQIVKTEYEGKWHITRVREVDASLVRLMFDQDRRLEWIYRGSTRLGPLFTELEKQNLRKEKGGSAFQGQRRQRRDNAPLIEYTRQNEGELSGVPLDADGAPKMHDGIKKQNVARKSMGNRNSNSSSGVTARLWESLGEIFKVNVSDKRAIGKPFTKHSCAPKCIDAKEYQYNEEKLRGTNPLLIPLLIGWDRTVTSHYGKIGNARRSKKVMYTAPCGRRLRNLEEVHRYLRITHSTLEIDFFNYEWYIKVFDEFKSDRILSQINDLSYGKENVPISCVNSVENNYPEFVEYSNVRIPKEKVFINTEKEFLVGCDCVDDCQDKDSCNCQQLTIQATGCDMSGKINQNVGYKFRRLNETVATGIYECNSKCACAKTCLNRVVQHPLRNKLQVFKTKKRGWGVRTLCDIPTGAFICIYVGNLFESVEGNSQGQNFGDEYFAQLDMIENVESRKEGYESDVDDDDDDDLGVPLSFTTNFSSNFAPVTSSKNKMRDLSSNISTEDEDEDNSGERSDDKEYKPVLTIGRPRNTDRVSRSKVPQNDGLASGSEDSEGEARVERVDVNNLIQKPDPFLSKLVKRVKLSDAVDTDEPGVFVEDPGQVDGAADCSDDDEMEVLNEKRPQRSGFSATAGISGPKKQKSQTETFKSSRKFFGQAEEAYIMDAKSIGNIGRYLNHSCGPNCFVQSVFVDTHDLRFHWVAFFSSTKIGAGDELSWDYSYEVGSINGKELYCECGAEQCRGRLL